MSADFAHTAHARERRLVKADRLAAVFIAAPGPWPASERERRLVERIAGVRTCSDETWQLAHELLADYRTHHPLTGDGS